MNPNDFDTPTSPLAKLWGCNSLFEYIAKKFGAYFHSYQGNLLKISWIFITSIVQARDAKREQLTELLLTAAHGHGC